MKVIGFMTTGISNIHMRSRLIKKMADMKNQRIWGANALGVACLKIWGASPRVTKLADIYMSLQRGALSGLIFPTTPLHSFRLTDLVNKHTIAGFLPGAQLAVMNLKRWKSLPPDIQKMVLDIGDESLPMAIKGMLDTGKVGRKRFIEKGKQVFTPTKAEADVWYKAFQPLEDQWLADCKKKGLKEAPMVLEFYKAAAAATWK